MAGWLDYLGGLAALGGLAGTGFGIAHSIGQQRDADRARRDFNRQVNENRAQANQLINAPIDWLQFEAPVSDAERSAMARALKADFASRGIPMDSMVASDLVAQRMAETAGSRRSDALNRGLSHRQTQIAGIPQPAAMMPPMGGLPGTDLSPIFRWMTGRQQQQPQQQKPTGTSPAVAASLANTGATTDPMWGADPEDTGYLAGYGFGPGTQSAPWLGADPGFTNSYNDWARMGRVSGALF